VHLVGAVYAKTVLIHLAAEARHHEQLYYQKFRMGRRVRSSNF